MMNKIISVVAVALAAFVVSYLVADLFERLGLDPSIWYYAAMIVILSLLILVILSIVIRLIFRRVIDRKTE